MRAAAALLTFGVIAGGCAVLATRTEHARVLATVPVEAKLVGANECIDCHTTVGESLGSTVHAKNLGCETCHGPGDMHVADGPGFIAGKADLAKMSARGQAEMCLSCHESHAVNWMGSDHARGGVSCQQCHNDAVHFKQEGTPKPPAEFATATDFCTQCHASDAAAFNHAYRHPVMEGEMGCNDCHSTHGERQGGPLAGCATCHAEQAGPKVFRHAALDEGCATCHVAHGGPLPALLQQDGNGLCLQCHMEPGFPMIAGVDHRDALAAGDRCNDCHVEIHGSNSDPSLLGRMR